MQGQRERNDEFNFETDKWHTWGNAIVENEDLLFLKHFVIGETEIFDIKGLEYVGNGQSFETIMINIAMD
jgi:hypothetical protein